MLTGLVKDIADQCPRDVRLLGLDLGTKTIGLAISNDAQTIATSLKVIERTKFIRDLEEVAKVVKEYEVGGLVFGWPLNMDGTRGASCDRVQSFVDEMKNYPQMLGTDVGTSLWIGYWDERLSTDAVEDFLVKSVDMSRTKRDKIVDKLAAQLILSGALERIANIRQS
jgi:putative Holliday junction resolvase